jgi:cholesterol transport system auxiliary component
MTIHQERVVKKRVRLILVLCVIACTSWLSACATRPPVPVLYDFGPLDGKASPSVNSKHAPRLPPISIAEVNAPAWLDGPLMFYRLGYANVQQPRPYAGSRWSMTPAQLLNQRLKARIAQDGGTVLSATDGAANTPLLRIDTDEFVQIFGSPTHSSAQVSLRASVFNGHILLAQKRFVQQVDAPSADAAGGARALADASDAVIDDILGWLAGLLPQK